MMKDNLLLEYVDFIHEPMLKAYLGKEAADGESWKHDCCYSYA